MKYLIGIDIGTSATKAVLFDETGKTIAEASADYRLSHPQPAWAEQDPQDWWEATVRTINVVMKSPGVSSDDVAGVGITGQMHGLVLLDEKGAVLRPSILWCDQRTAEEADDITNAIGRDDLVRITGNPAMTGFTAAKMLWVRKYEPGIWAKTAKILLPKDYVRYRLTGVMAFDVSDASGTQLLDIERRDWSHVVLEKLGFDKGLLSKVYESPAEAGRVTSQAAKLTGLRAGTIIAAGAGDQAAAAVGNGIIRPGAVSVNVGSSGVVFVYSNHVVRDLEGRVHTLCHAVPGAWHMMGVTQGAGLSMKWFKDQFYDHEKKNVGNIYQLIDSQAALIPPGSAGLYFLPYLMGERSPHMNPTARGVFFGISANHTKAHFTRALMEGVAYSLKDCLEVFTEMGIEPTSIRLSGGAGSSEVWRGIIADVFGTDLDLMTDAESGTRGAAILAGVASGIFGDIASAAARFKWMTQPVRHNPDHAEMYRARHRLYQKLYSQLKPCFNHAVSIESEM